LNSNRLELIRNRKEKGKKKSNPATRSGPARVSFPSLAAHLFPSQPKPAPFLSFRATRAPLLRFSPASPHASPRSGSAAFVPVRLTSGPRLSASPSRKPRARRLQRGHSPARGTAQHQHHPGPVLRQRPLARCHPRLRPTRAAPRPSARGPAFLSTLSPDLHGSFGRDWLAVFAESRLARCKIHLIGCLRRYLGLAR